jgi:hypothetical protein
MQKQIAAILVIAGLAFSPSGCKAQEKKPPLPAGHPTMDGSVPPMSMQNAPKIDRNVVISKEVKEKWKAVKLVIEDKAAKTSKEYIVNLGADLAVPNTSMSVKVLAFLPHFSMGDTEITSKSNEPTMPAAQVRIQEPGKPEWKGWLFSLVPDMHPFEHEKLAIKLAGGVAQ